MGPYRFVLTRSSGGQSSTVVDCPDDLSAIMHAGKIVSETPVLTVAVGRGDVVCEVEWLGAWDATDGWKPEE